MEQHLLECLLAMQKAGEHETSRNNALRRSPTWNLLNKQWIALAMLAASKEAPASVEEKETAANARNTGGRAHRARGGRRRRGGKRGGRNAAEDTLPSPEQALASNESAGFRLAVLLAQKHKMGNNWDPSLDDAMNLVRMECEAGVHPVWSRLAREAPIFAELERFDILDVEDEEIDVDAWLEAARFDPADSGSMQLWLSKETPFKLSASQAVALDRIKKDLKGKPRYSDWAGIMNPSLLDLDEEASFLEVMLLLASGDSRAEERIQSIKAEGKMAEVLDKHLILRSLQGGDFSRWREASAESNDDALSSAIRITAWNNIPADIADLTLDELLEGAEILRSSNHSISDSLRWQMASLLIDEGRAEEALEMIESYSLDGSERIRIALQIVTNIESEKLEKKILKALNEADEALVAAAMSLESAPISIQSAAAKILANSDDLRFTDEILSVFTRTADVISLAKKLSEEGSLARAYPFRALMIWHLIPASTAVEMLPELHAIRSTALDALDETGDDDVLSDASIALISLLAGIPSSMDSVHKKLDSEGVVILNQVRRALSSEGDGLVKETLIESLEQSIERAPISHLEERLFTSLISALRLNSAAMQLQLGGEIKSNSAIATLEELAGSKAVTMRTIKSLNDLLVEHTIGIESLEKWYRVNGKDSAEYQIVRAAVERGRGNRANAARAYKEAALKSHDDYESSSLLLRRSLIEYAHAGVWKEAVDLLDSNPELMASVTQRFQLYLRTCADTAARQTDRATRRLIEFVTTEVRGDSESEEFDHEFNRARKESLELLQRYPSEHNLPKDLFRGRVKAALRELEKSGGTRQSDLERRFQIELHDKKDLLELTFLGGNIAEQNPLRGIRRFEEAIESGYFDEKGVRRLRDTQRAVFGSHSGNIPVKDRRALRNLGLQPLILVDTNILIDALKDDLLKEISSDQYGSLDWTAERSFHMMLRRRSKADLSLAIPPSAFGEFTHRTKSPTAVLSLFSDVYIDRKEWKKTVTPEFLEKRVKEITKSFSTWTQRIDQNARNDVKLEEFLVKHEKIFEMVDEHKRRVSSDTPKRTVINDKDIYPERGDMDIMEDAAALASSALPGIGCVLVATRDSDFRLVARALEERYGFGVVSDAQQLQSRIQ